MLLIYRYVLFSFFVFWIIIVLIFFGVYNLILLVVVIFMIWFFISWICYKICLVVFLKFKDIRVIVVGYIW